MHIEKQAIVSRKTFFFLEIYFWGKPECKLIKFNLSTSVHVIGGNWILFYVNK